MSEAIFHPEYSEALAEWEEWRDIIDGGKEYIEKHLQQFSKAENTEDFTLRKEGAYNPGRARAALLEIKNSIFQRLADVVRVGGSKSYHSAVDGLEGGVDQRGRSMMAFLGDEVIVDLIGMGAVFVYVDMPVVDASATLADKFRPYLYTYRRENVLSWDADNSDAPGEFKKILLRRWIDTTDDKLGLPNGQTETYRYITRSDDGVVTVTDYNLEWEEIGETLTLGINRIPIVKLDVKDSLLKDIGGHQNAMLQLANADMAALVSGNFSLYVEQIDPRWDNHNVGPAHETSLGNAPGGESTSLEERMTNILDNTAPTRKYQDSQTAMGAGPTRGRAYIKGMDQPDFINPSPEPAIASMGKQEKMSEEIRVLVNLALNSYGASYAAAASKELDKSGLEAGLSYIGLQCHSAEIEIAEIWTAYEGKGTAATVTYPSSYAIKSDKDRRQEAKEFRDLQGAVPSMTYQKRIALQIANLLIGDMVSQEQMEKIKEEIESAKGITSDPEIITQDIENNLLSRKTASGLRGYGGGEAALAKEEHLERVVAISEAQASAKEAGAARGAPDLSGDPNEDGKLGNKPAGEE